MVGDPLADSVRHLDTRMLGVIVWIMLRRPAIPIRLETTQDLLAEQWEMPVYEIDPTNPVRNPCPMLTPVQNPMSRWMGVSATTTTEKMRRVWIPCKRHAPLTVVGGQFALHISRSIGSLSVTNVRKLFLGDA